MRSGEGRGRGAPDATTLVIFARAPEPGRVKTRLIPAFGAAGAARLHEAFLDDTCRLTRGAAARRVLAVAPSPDWPQDPIILVAREGDLVRSRDGGRTWE